MKKTLLALVVASISTSALAAGNIYENDQTSLNVKGEIDTYLSTRNEKTNDVKSKKAEADIDLWAKVQFDAKHKLNDDVTVFGSFELENGNGFGYGADDNSVRTDDLYVGAYLGKNWGVAVGEVGDFGDSLDAITIDNTNEGYGYVDDFVNSVESAGHAVSVKGKFDALTVIADAYLDQKESNDVAYGLSAKYTVNDMLTLGASYQDQGKRNGTEYNVMGVAAYLTLGDFAVAANYVAEEKNKADFDAVSAALSYQIDSARLYTSFGFGDGDADAEHSFYTLGADYKLSSNLLTFVEYSFKDDETTKGTQIEDTLVVAGVYFTF
ncbi:porin [Vibrio navarrensis]|uniref:porin n=1 Tax=Vibrio navarrensis TaxID=29495 RepID=UPI001868E38B|nr:porin [Vibrio navarrensis]EJK2115565.1 porin [Vibrio navarrensis]MBE3667067.1 porin [Vibrio navarrensis]MBE4577723.1 porin [Vibrio navarrensis]MBE4596962.1 porin [Vibrio navarrensis]